MKFELKFTQALLFIICFIWSTGVAAQELTPRLFWPTPEGTKLMVTGYSYSAGDVFFDQSVPITDADSKTNTGILAYAESISLWGRTSNILFSLPYAWGTSRGLLEDNPAQRDFSGFGDLDITLNVNLAGAPTMTKKDFLEFRANPRPLFGASIKLAIPTGQYNPDRLVNVGANRWATRLKLGGIIPLKPTWLLELSASSWFFGDNNDYLAGKKEQDPIFGLETNLIKRIRPGFWASLDLTYFRGGRQTIGGKPLRDYQKNMKLGGTIVIPFLNRHAIKIGYANGVITRYGNDFKQILLSYQMVLR